MRAADLLAGAFCPYCQVFPDRPMPYATSLALPIKLMRITVNILLGIKEEIDTAAWRIIRDDGY